MTRLGIPRLELLAPPSSCWAEQEEEEKEEEVKRFGGSII